MKNANSLKGERVVAWTRPVMDFKSVFGMQGMHFLSAVRNGLVPPPPIWNLVNFCLTGISEGCVVLEMDPAEYHLNRAGVVQGGIECAVLDAAAGCAIHSTLPAGMGYTTLELKTNYLRPILIETGRIRCVGSVLHKGSRTAVARAEMMDYDDTVYAHAISTCLIFTLAEGIEVK